jgi:hypothetical protein
VYWCDSVYDSCEVEFNPGQKVMRFSLYPDYVQERFGYCAYIHVVPYGGIGVSSNGTAYVAIATIGTGTTEVYFDEEHTQPCYTGPHLHQTANGSHLMDPAYSPASGGNTDYWGWYA